MDIKSIRLMYFSPTKTTKRIVKTISTPFSECEIIETDFTTLKSRKNFSSPISEDLVIIGVPVYFGRVEVTAMEFIKNKLKAENVPTVLVTVYGNRNYGDSLLELKNETEKIGFVPMFAGAFIGEHSYSTNKSPVASNRPDLKDEKKAIDFGLEIKTILEKINSLNDLENLEIRGNFPYRKIGKIPLKKAPKTNEKLCNNCKACANNCPVEAISFSDVSIANNEKCILCMGCVKICKANAKVNKSLAFKFASSSLSKKCSDRKEPETFLPVTKI